MWWIMVKEMNEMDYGLKKMNDMNYRLNKVNEMEHGLKEVSWSVINETDNVTRDQVEGLYYVVI